MGNLCACIRPQKEEKAAAAAPAEVKPAAAPAAPAAPAEAKKEEPKVEQPQPTQAPSKPVPSPQPAAAATAVAATAATELKAPSAEHAPASPGKRLSDEEREEAYKKKKEAEEEHSQEIERDYQALQAAVEEHAKKRGEYFEQSKAAFESGDKGLAKELSDKGKEEGRLMEEARLKAAEHMFNIRNKDKDGTEIDLHGLQVEFAMKFVEKFVAESKAKGLKEIVIITGAGNHSEGNNAKIKPKVHDYCKEQDLTFEEVNNGSIKITL